MRGARPREPLEGARLVTPSCQATYKSLDVWPPEPRGHMCVPSPE